MGAQLRGREFTHRCATFADAGSGAAESALTLTRVGAQAAVNTSPSAPSILKGASFASVKMKNSFLEAGMSATSAFASSTLGSLEIEGSFTGNGASATLAAQEATIGSVAIRSSFTGTNASLRQALSGATGVTSCVIDGSLTGSGASLESFAAGAEVTSASITNSLGGANARATRAFSEVTSLTALTIQGSFGTGASAGGSITADRLADGCTSLKTVSIISSFSGNSASFAMGLSGDEALESLEIEGSFTGSDPLFERAAEGSASEVAATGGARVSVKGSFTGNVTSTVASARRAFAGMADAASVRIENSFTKTLSAEEMLEGFGSGRESGVSVELSGSFTGGASLKGMMSGAFGRADGVLVVSGASSGVAPETMEGFLKGASGLARADLSGIWAASANMKEAYLGCAGLTSVQMGGDGSASGALTLPATWSGLAAADKTRMLAGCTGLVSAAFTGSISGGVTDEMMSGCSEVASVSFSGSPAAGVTSMKRMFSGCETLASLDLTGVSTAGMAGDFSTTGNLSAQGSMFEGCGLLVTATGAAAASPATITVGAQFGKLLNGFFGLRCVVLHLSLERVRAAGCEQRPADIR